MSIFGGLAFGSFYLIGDKTGKILLMSALYLALNLFVLGVKMYFLDLLILKLLSIIFFVFGHFFLVKYLLFAEQ
jgi:hypothetical protein